MPRQLCDACCQPIPTCLCAYISKANHNTSVTIIQCGKESEHAKNTANLLPKLSPAIRIVCSENSEEVSILKQDCIDGGAIVLFPSNQSVAIDQWRKDKPAASNKAPQLLVVDGTWRKAKRFILENDWIQTLPHVQLSHSYDSRYDIRKTSVTNGLSTLEAIGYALQEIEGADIAPFLHLLNGINTVFISQMPDEIKHRYNHNK